MGGIGNVSNSIRLRAGRQLLYIYSRHVQTDLMDWDIPPEHSLSFPVHPPYLRPLLPKYLQEHHRKHTILLPSYLLDPPPPVGWGKSGVPYLFFS
jgi:hypothetical protein